MLSIGDRIDDVEILAPLRRGGMATLYLGRRTGVGGFTRDLAVKAIHPELALDEDLVDMFVDEARLSALIVHPNVVRVESLREKDGALCLLMELIHGASLSQLLAAIRQRGLRPSPELAVAIAIAVAEGLHAAHELVHPDGTPAQVVHRDVSPSNVLIGYRGEIKLIDFGIAKATQRRHQTVAASIKGKLEYMSPEQALGRAVDRRADVYALGVVLWEMLAQRKCFVGENDLALFELVREPSVPPPSRYSPDLPPALDRVVLDALAPDRSARIPTTRELRQRLLAAMPGAASIDALAVSAVVCEVMAEKIVEDRELFSSSFSIPSAEERDAITLSRLLRGPTSDEDQRPTLHDPQPPPVLLPAPTSPRGSRRVPLWIGALVGLLLGVGSIWALATRAAPRVATRPTIVVTASELAAIGRPPPSADGGSN